MYKNVPKYQMFIRLVVKVLLTSTFKNVQLFKLLFMAPFLCLILLQTLLANILLK